MIGFALEGGGAKGAYQAGAYIALRKNGIKPSIIAGTSIGSVNAALMAQGDVNKLVNIWLDTTTDIFGINSEIIDKIKSKRFSKSDIKPTFTNIKEIIKNKGIDTTLFLNTLKTCIDEKKLRKSDIKFGLITVKMHGKPTPLELTIDDIPEGKVAEYIMASCYLPIFKLKPIIDNNYYIDGGFYNNVPLSLLEKQGCDTIYSIRIKGIGFNRNKLKGSTKVIEIAPRKNLGSIILFNKESNERNMLLGYYDALKVIKNLDGLDYYFKNRKDKYYDRIVRRVNSNTLESLKKKYHTTSNKKLVIKIIEKIFKENNISPFKIYSAKYAIRYIKKNIVLTDRTLKKFIDSCKLI